MIFKIVENIHHNHIIFYGSNFEIFFSKFEHFITQQKNKRVFYGKIIKNLEYFFWREIWYLLTHFFSKTRIDMLYMKTSF